MRALLELLQVLLILEELSALSESQHAVQRRAHHFELAIEQTLTRIFIDDAAANDGRRRPMLEVILLILITKLLKNLVVLNLDEVLIRRQDAALKVHDACASTAK